MEDSVSIASWNKHPNEDDDMVGLEYLKKRDQELLGELTGSL